MPARNSIVMPKLGLTMTEGMLTEWQVRPGDKVTRGQILFVVETDKIANEVEATAAGEIIDVIVGEGTTVNVGEVVAIWTGPGPDGEADAATPESDISTSEGIEPGVEAQTTKPNSMPAGEPARRPISPFARRMAIAKGVDFESIEGTGGGGRIKARDVRAALTKDAVAQPRSTARGGLGIRRAIAERLTRSKLEIPHFYLSADAEVGSMMRLRGELNVGSRPKVSVTHLLVAAVGRALEARRSLNVVWRENALLELSDVAVGVATDTDAGVRMPVIVDAGRRSPHDIAVAMDEAVARARSGRLRQDDRKPAAISISNVGMFGVRSLTPIIDPDQSYILGVGAPQSLFRPASDGTPRATTEISLTLASDHRVIDGAAGAEFLRAIVALIECPLDLFSPPSPSSP